MEQIPKVIHYCWFGHNPLPDSMEKCLASWKKHCPDYEIRRWDESNFDVGQCRYCKQAYDKKKYGFVTDYARLKVIFEEGGIYLDTDVELVKPLDPLLENTLFMGAEGVKYINTGEGFGAVSHHPFISELLHQYESMDYVDEQGNIISKNQPFYTSEAAKKFGITFPISGIQRTNLLTVYPNEYFNPYDWKKDVVNLTEHTYSIHHYAATWMTPAQKHALIINSKLDGIEKKYGHFVRKIADFCVWNSKKEGGAGVLKAILRKLR